MIRFKIAAMMTGILLALPVTANEWLIDVDDPDGFFYAYVDLGKNLNFAYQCNKHDGCGVAAIIDEKCGNDTRPFLVVVDGQPVNWGSGDCSEFDGDHAVIQTGMLKNEELIRDLLSKGKTAHFAVPTLSSTHFIVMNVSLVGSARAINAVHAAWEQWKRKNPQAGATDASTTGSSSGSSLQRI